MRKLSVFVAMLATMAIVSSAQASLNLVSVGDTLEFDISLSYRTGSGGEFAVSKTAPTSAPNYFHTFCAEVGEYISDGQKAYVNSLGLTSQSSAPVNTLTYGAAKLFSDYYNGIAASSYGFGAGTDFVLGSGSNTVTFSLSDTGAGRAADGQAVQYALWALIGEADSPAILPGSLTGDALKLYNAYVGTAAAGSGDAYYGVRIANLVGVNSDGTPNLGVKIQDQFVKVVPEASTIAVWSVLSLVGAGVAYRKRMAKA